MKPDLYKYVDTARKHESSEPQPVVVDGADQAHTGVEWCRRQGERPPEPPVVQGPKAMPIPN